MKGFKDKSSRSGWTQFFDGSELSIFWLRRIQILKNPQG